MTAMKIKYVLMFSLLIFLFSISAFANETVTIVDENGEVQICKVTESGVISFSLFSIGISLITLRNQ